MPHSGGGGSSHGGHHSSSSSRSSRSGGNSSSSYRTGTSYFSGSRVYVRYVDRQPQYLYTNRPGNAGKHYPLCIFYLVIMLILLVPAVRFGTKLGWGDVASTDVEIEDHGYDHGFPEGYLGDTSRLEDTLEDVRDKTGMVPVVIALDNSEWDGYSLETYAYNLYVARYGDEKHIMLVFSYGKDGSQFGDWHWESMYGDDTAKLLTPMISDQFGDDLHRNFLRCSTPAEAIDETFQKYEDKFLGIHIDPSAAAGVIFVSIWFGIIFSLNALSDRRQKKKLEGYTEVKDPVIEGSVPKEDKCDYCDGLYVIGSYLSCPHCGAPLPAHDSRGNRIANAAQ